MPILSYSDVDNLRSTLISNRSRKLEMWRVLAEFMSPNQYKHNHDKHNASRKDQKIINNIARRALRTFVSGMMNGATSQSRPWFKLAVTSPNKSKSTLAMNYFSQLEDVFNAHFQISNLYRVLAMSYKDVGLFSTSAFAMLPHPRYGFYFYPFAIGTYCIASDAEGNTNTFSRDFSLSVRQTVERYGKLTPTGHIDWTNFDDWIKQSWEQNRYLDQVTLTNLILPNAKPKSKSVLSSDKAYQSYTYVKAMGSSLPSQNPRRGGANTLPTNGGNFLSVKGFEYFPIIAPRWEVSAEEDYGQDGPGDIALGDVQTIQEKEKFRLEALAKLVKPPMVGPTSLRRYQSSILAGGITYVDEANEGSKFRPAFEVDPKLSELVTSIEKYEKAVGSAFFTDLFLMLSNERVISHRTATEITEQKSETLAAIGPVLGQLDQDQNTKIIDNAFYLLSQIPGKLPIPPKELEGEELRPEYISVLAQAAKASMVNSTERFVGFTTDLAQRTGDPTLIKMLKADTIVRRYGSDIGVDPKLIADELEYEEIKAISALQAQQQQKAQQMAQAAATAKDMSSAKFADGESSLLDKVAEEGEQA